MRVFKRIAGGFRALVRKTRVEQDLDAELRGYLDAAVEEKMRRGLSREDACAPRVSRWAASTP